MFVSSVFQVNRPVDQLLLMRLPLESDGILGHAEQTVAAELMKAHFLQTLEAFTYVPAVTHCVLNVSFSRSQGTVGTRRNRKSRAVCADKYRRAASDLRSCFDGCSRDALLFSGAAKFPVKKEFDRVCASLELRFTLESWNLPPERMSLRSFRVCDEVWSSSLRVCALVRAEETHFSPTLEGLRRLSASERSGIWLGDLSGFRDHLSVWSLTRVFSRRTGPAVITRLWAPQGRLFDPLRPVRGALMLFTITEVFVFH
ncbi:hypothetical protein Q8A67_021825 [Cirrhinus molitorella]|uniref:Uncharacterized protein n=1 Tax=Cirrhinus molitorella TaxID=172907 RepID=A0AA88PCA2_9TELE|nr:hypothetical protein Q8A67_021825 [Cirrhinus molitorella]